MKKRIIALFVLIALCLSSCSQESVSDVSGDPSSPVEIFVEIPDRIKYGEAFEVRVGFYLSYYPYCRSDKAELRVHAINFDIILPDGSVHKDRYNFEYSDFTDSKYDTVRDEETGEHYPKYYESFTLVYRGPDDYVGHVSFTVTSPQVYPDPGEKGGTYGNSRTIYYKVRWKYIRWNIKRPRNYTKDFM